MYDIGSKFNGSWTLSLQPVALEDTDPGTSCIRNMLSILLISTVHFLWPFVLPTCLSLVCCRLWSTYNCEKRDETCALPLPPGGFGLPLIGETLYLLLFSKRYFGHKRGKYGNVYKTHVLGKPTIRVSGPENVKKVLRGENTLVETQWPTSTCIMLGEGCVSHTSGSDHMTKKRIITRAFGFNALAGYVPIIQNVSRQYIRKWCKDKCIMGYTEFKLLTFDLSCRLLAGFQMNPQECKQLMDVFEIFSSNIFSIPVDIPGFGFSKGMKAREFLLKKIDECMVENEKSGLKNNSSVLGILLENQSQDQLSTKELKNLCLELLFAGHGTTSSAASYLVFELAQHPEVVEKIQEEIKAIGLLGRGNGNDIDLVRLNKMTYVNNVVKEALRLCPPIGGGYRKALKTFDLGGYQVPKGWAVTYSIRDTHETDAQTVNPDQFDPDRWSQQPSDKTTNFQYIPFGGGRRVCAGKDLARLMLKIFTLELVRNSHWQLQSKSTKFSTFPLPIPTDYMPLIFTAKTDDFRIRAHTV